MHGVSFGTSVLVDGSTYKMVTEAFFEGFDAAEKRYRFLIETVEELDEKLAEAEWIPCSERSPKELEAVNVTWINHNPPVYYQHIKDIPQTDTAVYYRGKWYWWDATVIDLLGEYDGAYIHGIEPIDKDIEVVAWMPLPKPYREDGEV